MSWRETLLAHFGPGTLALITLGRWLRVLRDNHFSIDPPYWGRAATITLGAIPNTVFGWRCRRFGSVHSLPTFPRVSRDVKQAHVHVIGHTDAHRRSLAALVGS